MLTRRPRIISKRTFVPTRYNEVRGIGSLMQESIVDTVIASVNCFSGGEWISFASQLEEAGADALELNVFILP